MAEIVLNFLHEAYQLFFLKIISDQSFENYPSVRILFQYRNYKKCNLSQVTKFNKKKPHLVNCIDRFLLWLYFSINDENML